MTIETAGRVNKWISSSTDNNMMVYFSRKRFGFVQNGHCGGRFLIVRNKKESQGQDLRFFF